MKLFEHVNVTTIHEALTGLKSGNGKAVLIAGGTDLLAILKDQVLAAYPETIINLKTIPELEYIREDSAGLTIGAMTRLADIVGSPALSSGYQGLIQAAASVATPEIRNMGTIGGNLCQHVRCWYYRYPHQLGGRIPCRRKGSGACPALKGDNRYHSIAGGKACYAVCPSDLATALSALDGKAIVSGPGGNRIIPVRELYRPVGNVLKTDEMITEIQVPKCLEGSKQIFLKYTLREPVDFAIVSVASNLTFTDGVCTGARIVLGAVAPAPLRAEAAERVIMGKRIDPPLAEEAANAALAFAKPLSMNAYKVEISKVLVKRALLSCAAPEASGRGGNG